MYLRDRDMPPGWPSCTEAGRIWRRAGDGYWWLQVNDRLWRRADSLAAQGILGIPVPGAAALHDQPELPGPRRGTASIVHFSGNPGATAAAGGGGGGSSSPGTALPDGFADLAVPAPGPGCCRDCHLDDSQLHEGLCRWCWQLASLGSRKIPAPARAQPGSRISPDSLLFSALAAVISLALLTLIFC